MRDTMNITVTKEDLGIFKRVCEETGGVEFIEYDSKFEWAKIYYKSASSVYYLGAFFQNGKTKQAMGWL